MFLFMETEDDSCQAIISSCSGGDFAARRKREKDQSGKNIGNTEKAL